MPDELLLIVDENDNPLPYAKLRSEVHRTLEYWHRVTAILVTDGQRNLLCHQRSLTKEANPGAWAHNFGGHVKFGETTLQNSINEMKEELGLDLEAEDLTYVGKEFFPNVKHVDYIYTLTYHPRMGEPKPDPSEVIGIRWLDFETAAEWSKTGKFAFPIYQAVRAIF